MLGGAIGFVGVVGKAMLVLAGFACVFAGFEALRLGLARRSGRYDLNQLRRIHEEEELDSLDPGYVSDHADVVVCAHCGNSYSSRFPICPSCRLRS